MDQKLGKQRQLMINNKVQFNCLYIKIMMISQVWWI
ncbi:unnamed protein product (macronuclear) [Paramecium tetraurelia]|uniref:Uncharacterized protein n=1 Tax=Paramecium tetraurelia TaxID=5888 RepID=A0DRS9_PARTE|nr:uncharacterized protein GSPATT00019464001 [Paramecium tetraurelia]CAK85746.1 unnamed protein product [Paramecium tetraurelia]